MKFIHCCIGWRSIFTIRYNGCKAIYCVVVAAVTWDSVPSVQYCLFIHVRVIFSIFCTSIFPRAPLVSISNNGFALSVQIGFGPSLSIWWWNGNWIILSQPPPPPSSDAPGPLRVADELNDFPRLVRAFLIRSEWKFFLDLSQTDTFSDGSTRFHKVNCYFYKLHAFLWNVYNILVVNILVSMHSVFWFYLAC